MSGKTIVLLDVDGVLNPYSAPWHRAGRNVERPNGYVTRTIQSGHFAFKVSLTKAHGPLLLSLSDVAEIIWATTWNGDANRKIGKKIGLPSLPWIPLDIHVPATGRLMWKTPQIAEWLAKNRPGRDILWFDDEAYRADANWLTGDARLGEARVSTIDPKVGLSDEDVAAARSWIEARRAG